MEDAPSAAQVLDRLLDSVAVAVNSKSALTGSVETAARSRTRSGVGISKDRRTKRRGMAGPVRSLVPTCGVSRSSARFPAPSWARP